MRLISLVVLLPLAAIAACSTSNDTPNGPGTHEDAGGHLDASLDATIQGPAPGGDAGADASLDASSDADGAPDAATCPQTLLVGEMALAPQGWTVVTIPGGRATVTHSADEGGYVQLETGTVTGERSGGQLLITRPNTFEPGKPFKIQVVLRVVSVNKHNQFDSAAAILGSLHTSVGNANDRAQMIYLDSNAIGWADDTGTFPVSVVDGAYHTYELSVDAANAARVSIDGKPALVRNGFTSNGTLALGDQTNDPNVDAVTRIRSVTKLCP
ncbi:hypothetical protein [Pendulispora albinea]|uniref:Concanavalin A-like lectin/glucanase superfamily protein n=1 Tax=Pendulispora albinea TaxID=2741071 RepID=A0ABZ2M660_9BACT